MHYNELRWRVLIVLRSSKLVGRFTNAQTSLMDKTALAKLQNKWVMQV